MFARVRTRIRIYVCAREEIKEKRNKHTPKIVNIYRQNLNIFKENNSESEKEIII